MVVDGVRIAITRITSTSSEGRALIHGSNGTRPSFVQLHRGGVIHIGPPTLITHTVHMLVVH